MLSRFFRRSTPLTDPPSPLLTSPPLPLPPEPLPLPCPRPSGLIVWLCAFVQLVLWVALAFEAHEIWQAGKTHAIVAVGVLFLVGLIFHYESLLLKDKHHPTASLARRALNLSVTMIVPTNVGFTAAQVLVIVFLLRL